ncbi:uncharacterized protein PV09_03475 [Verruconis gallopava]|uniref:Ribosomal RNA-processing protein 14/surfeit locus protein 6 C-terminal domain-containing protein n=1 Tax=Verruconis gallopava TaxID=253628 RepID=A0A0D2B2T7_9PEZI|nr:uncharacterized protein PV09_03475 [Verruconis gallopava]KIW05604.1 hypothetical protein PV09_03475 [Verruconis gallopava]
MADDLEARLQSHAKAFEGLMSLLPPDLYYGKQNTENEWMKKKQTKEEKKAARKAKLNPANHKTAADVANERDQKRRLEEEEAERAAAGFDGPMERPGEGMAKPKAKAQKIAKGQDVHSKAYNDESDGSKPTLRQDGPNSKEERRKAKEQRRKEKQERKAAKAEKKKAKKQAKAQHVNPSAAKDAGDGEEEDGEGEDEEEESAEDATDVARVADIDAIDVSGLVDDSYEKDRHSSSRSPSPDPEFSPHHNDRASSTSSVHTSEGTEQSAKPSNKKPASKPSHPPKDEEHETPEQAKARKEAQIARLRALIEAKRKARKADGLDGKPARSRSELIEARRQKQQELKEKKKALRAQEREKLKKEEMEAHLASLRGSPVLGSELFAPRSRSASVSSPSAANNVNFSFNRVTFADGARLNSSLTSIDERKKRKGPSDTKTALIAAEKHQARLNSLDPSKRASLEEKDMWLHARQRVSGEKVLNDVSLLKKSLKRKEKAKSRSEKQWNERLEAVKRSQEARQRKREENIAKRREEKNAPKGKRAKTGAGVKKSKSKKRAGFEGTFRGRA